MNRIFWGIFILSILNICSIANAATMEEVTLEKTDYVIFPHQQKVMIHLFRAGKPQNLDSAAVKAVIQRAADAWNSELHGKLQLVVMEPTDPPKGEAFISVDFSSNTSAFEGAGEAEFAFVGREVYRGHNYAVAHIIFNDTYTFHSTGGFSITGAEDTQYDLQIVATHELGHALGLLDDPTCDHAPPIMCPKILPNGQLKKVTGKTIAELRTISPEDRQRLEYALQERDKKLNLSGTYSGTATTTEVAEGSAIPVGHATEISNFQIEQNAEKITVKLKGSAVESPITVGLILLASKKEPIKIDKVTEGTYIESVEFTEHDPEASTLKVKLVVIPMRHKIMLTGTLTKNK